MREREARKQQCFRASFFGGCSFWTKAKSLPEARSAMAVVFLTRERVAQAELQIASVVLAGDFAESGTGDATVGAAPVGVVEPVEGFEAEEHV